MIDPADVAEAVYNATSGGGDDNTAGIPPHRNVRRNRSFLVAFLKQISPFTTVEELLDALD